MTDLVQPRADLMNYDKKRRKKISPVIVKSICDNCKKEKEGCAYWSPCSWEPLFNGKNICKDCWRSSMGGGL